jgi:hypothetical protein
MRFFKVLCVLALALFITASAYAETQSVKVSGDLTMRGIFRNAYDYLDHPPEDAAGQAIGQETAGDQSWFMSVVGLRVDADLTDNVSTVVRLINQRDWNVMSHVAGFGNATALTPHGRGAYTASASEYAVMVDLAYVTLKDFIYSPLTVTIGRQDLWFGKGFIVGLNQQNPGVVTGNSPNLMVPGNLNAPEYTDMNSFDAIKAVLDYDPWTITGVYSKIYEDEIAGNDDVDLWGVNVGYKFDVYKAEAEAYWFLKTSKEIHIFNYQKHNANTVYTIGTRGSVDPIDWITLNGEIAVQGGQFVGSMNQWQTRNRAAWAMDIGGECRYLVDKYPWKPKFGAEYILYSGDEYPADKTAGLYRGWDPMYRGKFDSAIREFVGRFYQTWRYPANGTYYQSSRDASYTNQQQMVLLGSVEPIDSLTIKGNLNMFWNMAMYNALHDKSRGWVGTEFDLQANWDYTEDVSFNLLAGWFVPGQVYYDQDKNTATDLVASVKVDF